MPTLFEKQTQDEMIKRIGRLTADSHRQWGKMSASQMLKHLDAAFSIPLKKEHAPKEALYYLMANPVSRWLMFEVIPWPHGLPAPHELQVKDDPDYESAKKNFLVSINKFLTADAYPGAHPVFGKMDKSEWGKLMGAHLDHHLRQFGV
jgi:hypothetical protein